MYKGLGSQQDFILPLRLYSTIQSSQSLLSPLLERSRQVWEEVPLCRAVKITANYHSESESLLNLPLITTLNSYKSRRRCVITTINKWKEVPLQIQATLRESNMPHPVVDSNFKTYRLKPRNVPKSIVNFVKDLIEFNNTKEFERIRQAYEQNFEAHVLATISNPILKDPNKVYNDDEFTEESPTCKNNRKRKLGGDELPGYDGLVFLFSDSNEDTIIEKIDDNALEERKLPLASDNKLRS
ncbi:4003_t:CDS:2 [Acaulospora morrowiae]|uniref:4003_t:CDS:1 n=1 Tax=Acaulospora morrowiae TaxID=94023 RepID=A0A9N9B3U6_9GLOM|nr:4003_t:CDS:2 [Acaulospora morrowiae]